MDALRVIWLFAIVAVLCKQHNWTIRWGYSTLMLAWVWFAGFYWYRHRKGTTLVLLLVMGCVFGRFGYYDFADVTIVFSAAVLVAAPSIPVPRLFRPAIVSWGAVLPALHLPLADDRRPLRSARRVGSNCMDGRIDRHVNARLPSDRPILPNQSSGAGQTSYGSMKALSPLSSNRTARRRSTRDFGFMMMPTSAPART